jgi:hypothetical protein
MQFERELASERVRDKVAASRKKGKWTGGSVPLGYDAKTKKLVINKAEAETVRTVFGLYLELKSFGRLVAELDRRKIVTKRRNTAIARAHMWLDQLSNGRHASIEELAAAVNYNPKVIRQGLRLAFLAPHLTEAAATGGTPLSFNRSLK